MGEAERSFYTTRDGKKVHYTKNPEQLGESDIQNAPESVLARKYGNIRSDPGLGTAENRAADIKARMDRAKEEERRRKMKIVPPREEQEEWKEAA